MTPGSAVALIGCSPPSGLPLLCESYGLYSATSGSIGTVIVLLTWMYLSGIFILIGGEINDKTGHASKEGKDPGQKYLPNP
jgi:membrane protein